MQTMVEQLLEEIARERLDEDLGTAADARLALAKRYAPGAPPGDPAGARATAVADAILGASLFPRGVPPLEAGIPGRDPS